MDKLLILYRLKPGVKLEDYKRWSREVDQKTTPFQPGVKSFQVYELGSNPLYHVAEDIEVEDADNYPPKTKAMNRVVGEWEKYCDASSVLTLRGKRI
jgi:hypothetical protein